MPEARSENTDQIVGRNIRLRRREYDITQLELANHLGVSYQLVQAYEQGLVRVPSSRLPVIADYLGTTVDALFSDRPTQSAGVDTTTRDLSAAILGVNSQPVRSAIQALIVAIAESEGVEGEQR